MIDIPSTAEPKSGEPIFALDIDPLDPQIPPVAEPEKIAPYAEAAERLVSPDYAQHVYESFGGEPLRPTWDEYPYREGHTRIRSNEIKVDGTAVPVVAKITDEAQQEAEVKFANRWRNGDPGGFYARSLLQRGIPTEGIWMLDFKRLGYQELYPRMFVAMNMFTPKGRKCALEALKFGASWMAMTEPYGLVRDSFPKGFVIPGGSSPKMHLYRTYDYGISMDDPEEHFKGTWYHRGDGDITKNNGIFSWLPLLRPFDVSTTFANDGTIKHPV